MDLIGKYKEKPFLKSRLSSVDVCDIGVLKHHVKGLIELDVTEAREAIRSYRRKNGEGLSFTAWLIKCISQAVSEFPDAHALRKGNKKVIVFEDIDICVTVEREYQNEKVPLPYVIRKTNKKSLGEIHKEIRFAQSQQLETGDLVLGQKNNPWLFNLFLSIPAFFRKIFWINLLRNPFAIKKTMGTAVLTSIGMTGRFSGWAIPVTVYPLCFAAGTINKKPGVVKDVSGTEKIAIREFLHLTVLIDHDVMDGAPAARFIGRLAELVENSYGLDENRSI
jgi:pyruvate/2-oxoglutarate dehydrogenase complex dihydrolipoamide acyltransferase (E2) component